MSSRAAGSGESAKDHLLDTVSRYAASHGLADRSLRQVAADIGTSHRMLIYHFGSRDGLLAAIIDRIEQAQLTTLHDLMGRDDLTPLEQAWAFWRMLTDNALAYGPLFFELASAAMRGAPYAREIPRLAVDMWLEPLTALWLRAGARPQRAVTLARLGLATAHGILLDLLLTGDRDAADAAMTAFTESVVKIEL